MLISANQLTVSTNNPVKCDRKFLRKSSQQHYNIFDSKPSPCSECCMFYSG